MGSDLQLGHPVDNTGSNGYLGCLFDELSRKPGALPALLGAQSTTLSIQQLLCALGPFRTSGEQQVSAKVSRGATRQERPAVRAND